MTSMIYVNFTFDDESKNYVFFCDEPRIVGGAATLEEAQKMAGEALSLALGQKWTIHEPKAVTAKYQLATAH
jgi:predicted RNase H-like HicB family nuclease